MFASAWLLLHWLGSNRAKWSGGLTISEDNASDSTLPDGNGLRLRPLTSQLCGFKLRGLGGGRGLGGVEECLQWKLAERFAPPSCAFFLRRNRPVRLLELAVLAAAAAAL